MHVQNISHPYKLVVTGVMIAGVLSLGGLGVAVCIELLRGPGGPPSSHEPSNMPPPELPKEETPDRHETLAQSTDAQLRLLAAYEQRLGRGFSHNMLFADIPAAGQDISERVTRMAGILKEHERQGITPLVVFEPEKLDLRSVDKKTFEEYFAALKANGITDKEIGMWMLFPEPNIPEWSDPEADLGNTDPKLFVQNFTMAAAALKQTFPKAQTMLLLNGATYPSYDIHYTKGSFAKEDLLQYAQGLDRKLVDAVGLQGFPWGEQGDSLDYDPAVFLDADLAIALAKQLKIEKVWLNSGTFSSMYDWDPSRRVTVTDDLRGRILNGIAKQAEQVQNAGLAVTVNIFAEDKTATEANWSYDTDASWEVFQRFADRIEDRGIGLAFFDTPKIK